MKKSHLLLSAVSALALSPMAITSALAAEISGRVTDNTGTVPLRGAQIKVQESGQITTSKRDGSFRITGLPAGAYTVEVSYLGAPTKTVSISLDDDTATNSVNISLGNNTGDLIIVQGQRGSLNSALNQQRAADGIVTVLSADDIGQLPDENVAEAARRALGVSIANDQGEGRFISIRGINSQLNATSVNGVRLTSPEAGDRRVAMDVIDADVLKNVIINKTLSADMDGDAIGGSIELETISGLDRQDMLAKIKVGSIYSELSEEFGGKVSGTYANNYMNGKFGVALNGAFQSREFASDNQEASGWETGGTLPYPNDERELRNYDITRERLSLAANFDYQMSDNTKVYLHSLYNTFSDQEFRYRTELKVEDPADAFDEGDDLAALSFNGNEVTYSGTTEYEIDRDIKDRLEEQTIYSVVTGFEHIIDNWTFEGSVAFTQAEEEEAGRLDVNFDQDFDTPISLDVSNLIEPRLVFNDAATQAAYLDASGYDLDNFETTDGRTDDEELALTFDAKVDLNTNWGPGFFKTGLKARLRDKGYDLDFKEYSYEGGTETLANFLDDIDYTLDVFGPAPNPDLTRAFFNANVGNSAILELQVEDSAKESLIASYDAEEDIWAGYVMGQLDIDNLRLTAGVRVEYTEVSANANLFNDDTATAQAITFSDSYTDTLPSIAAKYAVTEDLNIRASYYASIVRPNFGQFVPAGETNDDDKLEIGNSALQRTEADNLDLLLEYYPTSSSVVQGGIFYKDLKNLITSFESNTPGIFNGVNYEELNSFINADDATIWGIELGYQQALDFLPTPLDGVIIGANYTYADSEVEIDGEKHPVPGQSEHIANLLIGYDKGAFDLRAALSYKSENLDDVDIDGVGDGRYILDQTFLDLSAKYRVTDTIKLYGEMKNVLDTPLEVSEKIDGQDYLNQYDEYGYTIQAGIIAKF